MAVLERTDGTVLTIEHDSSFVYETEDDDKLRRDWLAMLVSLVDTLGAHICLLRHNEGKQAITTAEVKTVMALHAQGDQPIPWSPSLVLAQSTVLSPDEAVELTAAQAAVWSAGAGLSVVSWLGRGWRSAPMDPARSDDLGQTTDGRPHGPISSQSRPP